MDNLDGHIHYHMYDAANVEMIDRIITEPSLVVQWCLTLLAVVWFLQATVAPPVTGKMFKGLVLCYSVIFVTFYSAAVSGYWAFGNKSSSNILKSLMPDEGPSLAPTWLLGLAVVFVLLQLFAIGLVSLPFQQFCTCLNWRVPRHYPIIHFLYEWSQSFRSDPDASPDWATHHG